MRRNYPREGGYSGQPEVRVESTYVANCLHSSCTATTTCSCFTRRSECRHTCALSAARATALCVGGSPTAVVKKLGKATCRSVRKEEKGREREREVFHQILVRLTIKLNSEQTERENCRESITYIYIYIHTCIYMYVV